jgi:hypothetical protein
MIYIILILIYIIYLDIKPGIISYKEESDCVIEAVIMSDTNNNV